jgi:hypothetical protein
MAKLTRSQADMLRVVARDLEAMRATADLESLPREAQRHYGNAVRTLVAFLSSGGTSTADAIRIGRRDES